MNLELEGRSALVTGSNRGTGEIIATRLRAEGARVVIHALTEDDSREAAARTGSLAVWGDIATSEGASRVFEQCRDLIPGLDILVNNYGTSVPGSWETATDEQWLEAYQRNTMSVARMVRLFLPDIRDSSAGRIVNLGTIGSTRPGANSPHYYAAKAALANLTVSLARELSGTGATANLVSPGLIRTPEVEAGFRRLATREGWGDDWTTIEGHVIRERSPNFLGRLSTREEVADLVVFLCSARAAFITAQNIRIDGGAVDMVH